jgi:hypothetical protein
MLNKEKNWTDVNADISYAVASDKKWKETPPSASSATSSTDGHKKKYKSTRDDELREEVAMVEDDGFSF